MKYIVTLALALAIVGAANAQTVTAGQSINTGSESNSNANSGSVSGSTSASDQQQGQQQGQTQGLQNSNANTAQQGNQQATNLTFEAAEIPTETTVNYKGNTTVALAAAVSFSGDNCMSIASGGASAAGVSIGASKPIADGNCQALRRAEKFGVAAANAYNMGAKPMAYALLQMQVWETCMAGNDAAVSRTAEACERLALIGPGELPHTAQAHEHMPSDAIEVQPVEQPRTIIRDARGNTVEVDPAAVGK